MIMMTRFLFHTPAKVAFDFGDRLDRGDTLDQGDFSQAKHDMDGAMVCRGGSPAKMTSASRKTVGFFIDAVGHTSLGHIAHAALAVR
jgi:hypothetical protein